MFVLLETIWWSLAFFAALEVEERPESEPYYLLPYRDDRPAGRSPEIGGRVGTDYEGINAIK